MPVVPVTLDVIATETLTLIYPHGIFGSRWENNYVCLTHQQFFQHRHGFPISPQLPLRLSLTRFCM